MKTKSECEQMRADWKSGMTKGEIKKKWQPLENAEEWAIVSYGANPEDLERMDLSESAEVISSECKKLGLKYIND